MNYTELKEKAKSSVKWSFMGELVSKLITPVSYLVLARILTPQDFGILSAGMVVISFSQIFWEAGLSKTLIQRQIKVDESANCIFWMNALLGLTISIVLFYYAELIVKSFFKEVEVINVIKILSFGVLFSSLSAVHTALLQKKFDYKSLFIVKFVTVAIPSLISIPLAKLGYGYQALVYGILIGQFGQFIILWGINKWKPTLSFDLSVAKSIIEFSSWVTLGSLLAWFYSWIDTIIIMKAYSSKEIGLYNFSNTIANTIFGVLFFPITPILYNILSIIDLKEKSKEIMLFVSKIYFYISIIIGTNVAINVYNFESILFSDDWLGIGLICAIISLSKVWYWMIASFYEAFRAVGKPNIEIKIMLISSPVYLVVFYYLSKINFMSVVYGKFLLPMTFGFFINMFFVQKKLDIKILEYLKEIRLGLIGFTSGLIIYSLIYVFFTKNIFFLTGVWGVILIACIYFILKNETKFIKQLKNIVNG